MFTILGSITVDLLITGMDVLPALGSDEFAQDNLVFTREPLRMVIGGNGANSAYVLGRLGGTVQLVGAVGEDVLGGIMRGWLESAGVDTHALRSLPEHGTSTTIVATDSALRRASFHHAGAYAMTGIEQLPVRWRENTRYLLLTSFPLLSTLRGDYALLLDDAHSSGITTLVDIGPAIGRPAILDELIPLAPHIDYLVTNEHELSVCCGGNDMPAALARLHVAGYSAVILKQGRRGAILSCPGRPQVIARGIDVTAKSTVGAGDSFNAGLMMALSRGINPSRALRYANATAAQVVSSTHGVLDSPTWQDVEGLVTEQTT